MPYPIKVRFARTLPDPVYDGRDLPKAERHIFMCSVLDIPRDLPKDANPRQQNIDRRIYRDVARHLVNDEGTPNTFHLKNKGITILAEKVTKIGEDTYELAIGSGQGIVDGAHTYEIILAHQDEMRESNVEDAASTISQFVKLEIITGIENGLSAEIAAGLNTAVQVQQMALKDLEGKFDWIKDEVRSQSYYSKIAFTQNASGEYDIRDILVMLELFNIDAYPNDGTSYPTRTWNNKEAVLSSFARDPEPYQKLKPILKDILILYDTVSATARDLYNEGGNRKGGRLSFVEGPKKSKFRFPFIDQEREYRLFRGALLPMVGAFRFMVVDDPSTGQYRWRDGFGTVSSLWNQVGQEMMDATFATSTELGRKLTALGKSPNLWARLHGIVMNRYLLKHSGITL